jgi:hypothetical protein
MSRLLGAQLITPALGKPRSSLLRGLVSWWGMDESSGTRYDSHGANDLTAGGSETQAVGKVGSSVYFPVTAGSYLFHNANASLQTGDIDFSIACWARWVGLGSGTIACRYCIQGNKREWRLVFVSGPPAVLRFVASADGTNLTNLDSSFVFSTNTWYFIYAYHDAVNNKIGISINNGAPEELDHAGGVYVSDEVISFGANKDAAGNFGAYPNARVDEFGFWKRLLRESERTWLYNSGNGRGYANLLNP